MPGHGTTAEPSHYACSIADLAPGRFRFRLRQVDFDGVASYSAAVELSVAMTQRCHALGARPARVRGRAHAAGAARGVVQRARSACGGALRGRGDHGAVAVGVGGGHVRGAPARGPVAPERGGGQHERGRFLRGGHFSGPSRSNGLGQRSMLEGARVACCRSLSYPADPGRVAQISQRPFLGRGRPLFDRRQTRCNGPQRSFSPS